MPNTYSTIVDSAQMSIEVAYLFNFSDDQDEREDGFSPCSRSMNLPREVKRYLKSLS